MPGEEQSRFRFCQNISRLRSWWWTLSQVSRILIIEPLLRESGGDVLSVFTRTEISEEYKQVQMLYLY